MLFGFHRNSFARALRICGAVALVFAPTVVVAGQRSLPATDAQRQAMRRLAFLAGRWSGPVTVVRGPGEPLHLTQTENVEFKLDGLVLLIEGESKGADGEAQFQALATVAYDEASHAFRFRAYNDGRYLDSELTVLPDGFAWGFNSGPAHIQNTMHLTAKGEWQETTEVIFGDNPPRRSVEMCCNISSDGEILRGRKPA
jgi:hypothetical protein